MKTNKILATLSVVVGIGIASYALVKNGQEKPDRFSRNVGALTMAPEGGGSTGTYKSYYNYTDKNKYTDKKVEYRKDSTGVSIKIEFKRSCTSYNTYCKHSRDKSDVCYGELNGLVKDCGEWSEN